MTDIVDLTIGPEEDVAGQSADMSLLSILEAAGEIPARGTAHGTESSSVPATSPLREERAEVTQEEEPAPSTEPIEQAVAVLSGALCVSPTPQFPLKENKLASDCGGQFERWKPKPWRTISGFMDTAPTPKQKELSRPSVELQGLSRFLNLAFNKP